MHLVLTENVFCIASRSADTASNALYRLIWREPSDQMDITDNTDRNFRPLSWKKVRDNDTNCSLGLGSIEVESINVIFLSKLFYLKNL